MSSEYLYDRRAIRLRGRTEECFLLLVHSHSSNDGEHVPHWWVQHIGSASEMMGEVLRYAHYCESEMTRGPRGVRISGQSHIKLWREAMRCARTLDREVSLHLDFCEAPVWRSIEARKLGLLLNLAKSIGVDTSVNNVVQTSVGGPQEPVNRLQIELGNPGHVDLLIAANRSVGFGSSKLIPIAIALASVAENLALGHPPQGRLTAESVEQMRCQDLDLLGNAVLEIAPDLSVDTYPTNSPLQVVFDEGQRLVSAGNPLRWFCETILQKMERERPGVAEAAYAKFKKYVASLKQVDAAALSLVLKSPEVTLSEHPERWIPDVLKRLWAEVPPGANASEAFKALPAAKNLTALHCAEDAELRCTNLRELGQVGGQDMLFAV